MQFFYPSVGALNYSQRVENQKWNQKWIETEYAHDTENSSTIVIDAAVKNQMVWKTTANVTFRAFSNTNGSSIWLEQSEKIDSAKEDI